MLKDVRKVGAKNSIVDVSDGYAINFLLPNKMAEIATSEKLERALAEQATHKNEKDSERARLVDDLNSLNGATIEIQARVTPKGSLFKSITVREIVDAVKTQKKITIPESAVALPQPIKLSGNHVIELHGGNKRAALTISVSASPTK